MEAIFETIKNMASKVNPPIALDNQRSTKGHAYWCDFANIEQEYVKLILKLGRFPKFSELSCAVKKGVQRHHGGHRKVAKKLGFSQYGRIKTRKKSNGFWLVKENLLKELLPICEKLNRFPTTT